MAMVGGTRVCFIRCNNEKCLFGTVLPFLLELGGPQDFMALNFGLHGTPDYQQELKDLASYYQVNQCQFRQDFGLRGVLAVRT